MKYVFLELFNYRPAWRELSQQEREAFANRLNDAMGAVSSLGIEVLGWGVNDAKTDRRAPHDFFCLYRADSEASIRRFEAGVAQSVWHEYFEQVGVTGAAGDPADLLKTLVALETT